MKNLLRRSIKMAALFFLLLPRGLFAQPPIISDSTPAVKPSESIHEQTIYIPYEKLRDVFEKQGRGVFLPYEKFQELWQAARDKPSIASPAKSPIDAIITEVWNDATVERDVVRVRAKLSIELLKQGWHQIPLRLADSAIQSAKIGEQAARVISAGSAGYVLLVENKEKQSTQIELTLEYARAYTKSPGQNSVSFDAPQAPVNRWRIRISEAGVKVNVHPMLAATEVIEGAAPNLSEQPVVAPTKETVILAFVGSAPQVRIDWTPKSEGAAGLAALADVQSQQEVFIDEGSVRTRAQLKYAISRAEVSQLTIEVPLDQKVVNVFDANVRKWEVEPKNNVQTITVQLFEPVRATQNIMIELEKFYEARSREAIPIAAIHAVDVGRQQGVVVMRVASTLRAEATRHVGLLQLDAGELPSGLAGQEWTFAYRYASVPFDLAVTVEKIEPRISVDQLVEVYLEPQQLTIDLLAVYNVEQAGVFQFEFEIPSGFDVRRVVGQEVAGTTAAQVDTHHLEGDTKSHLVVNLNRKALGRVGIWIELQKRLDDANLISPTGVSSTLAIGVPRATQEFLQRATGRLVLYAPESLRINPSSNAGQRSIALSDAFVGTQSMRKGRFSTARDTMALTLNDQPFSLELVVERRKPHVAVRQLLAARIDAGVVQYNAKFFYDIRYSGVKSLRIDVPADLVSLLRNTTPTIHERVLEPPPSDLKEGYVAWSLTGESELIGEQVVMLHWERKLEELEIGKSVDLQVPSLIPMEVDRSWGQIVIAKAETLDVRSKESNALRPIDPQHDLMSGAAISDAARAFEFHDAWSLQLTATRYQLEEVKRTSIERAYLRVVATRSSQMGVQAMYRMRSAQQRLAIHLPENVQFDAQPLRINGNPATLERGDKNELFVPLIGHDPGEPFLLELRYSSPGTPKKIDFPVFPDDPAVQKVYLGVYLPDEWTLLGMQGPWTEEWTWQSNNSLQRVAEPVQSDALLAGWVKEGINVSSAPAVFADGRLYLFSTLRPQPPPDGSLHLVTLNRKVFVGGAIGLMAIIGLGLLLRPAREKLIGVGLLLIAVVACGVFTPTFAQQMLNTPMISGAWIVAIVWFIWYAVRIWPRQWRTMGFDARPWIVRQPQILGATSSGVTPVTATADSQKSAMLPDSDRANDGGEHHA